MTAPLASGPQASIRYSTFSFGGNDRNIPLNPVFRNLAQWQIASKKGQASSFQQGVVYLAQKVFAVLDRIGVGTCFFGIRGFKGSLNHTKYILKGPERNAAAREKIVAALNTNIESVPVLRLSPQDLTDYLKLRDRHFQSGQWLVQGEDPAGRKFVCMRLQDRDGHVKIATIHQRYRETAISAWSGGGALWTLNFANDVQPGDIARITTFISQICSNTHPNLSFSIKP